MKFFSSFFLNTSSKFNLSLYSRAQLHIQPTKKTILVQKFIRNQQFNAMPNQKSILKSTSKSKSKSNQKLASIFKKYLYSYSRFLSIIRSNFSSKIKLIQFSESLFSASDTEFINIQNAKKFSKKEDGFSLIEAIIVISIVMALSLSAMQMHKVYYEYRCKKKTHENMKMILCALASYYITNYRMPLPARIDVSKSDSRYGLATESTICGHVPFKSIGISERYSLDGYGNKIIYIYSNNIGMQDSLLKIKDKSGNIIISNSGKSSKNGLMFILASLGKNYKLFKDCYKSNAQGLSAKNNVKSDSEYDYVNHNTRAISRIAIDQKCSSEDLYDINDSNTIVIWFSVGVFNIFSGYSEKDDKLGFSKRLSGKHYEISSGYNTEYDSN